MKKGLTLILLISGLNFAACTKKSEPAAVADVCQMDDGTLVAVEGFLVLPNFMNTLISRKTGITTYEIFLAAQPEGKSELVKISVSGTNGGAANHLAELSPNGYTQSDLRAYTDTGKAVGSHERVKVTGEISKTTSACILKIYKIETP